MFMNFIIYKPWIESCSKLWGLKLHAVDNYLSQNVGVVVYAWTLYLRGDYSKCICSGYYVNFDDSTRVFLQFTVLWFFLCTLIDKSIVFPVHIVSFTSQWINYSRGKNEVRVIYHFCWFSIVKIITTIINFLSSWGSHLNISFICQCDLSCSTWCGTLR